MNTDWSLLSCVILHYHFIVIMQCFQTFGALRGLEDIPTSEIEKRRAVLSEIQSASKTKARKRVNFYLYIFIIYVAVKS